MTDPEVPAATPRALNVAAVLLAAGLSRRMGALNKLLADIDGEAMVRRTARVLLESGVDLFVVTGHQREGVEQALTGLEITLVHNRDYEAGLQGSAMAGLAAVGSGYDAAIVALGDQPLLEVDDIKALIAAFARSDRNKFIVPYYKEARGNPVVVPRAILDDLAAHPPDPSLKRFTDRFPERIERFQADNDHFTRDIDTADALEEFRQRR